MKTYYPHHLAGHLVCELASGLFLVPMMQDMGWTSRYPYLGPREALTPLRPRAAEIQLRAAGWVPVRVRNLLSGEAFDAAEVLWLRSGALERGSWATEQQMREYGARPVVQAGALPWAAVHDGRGARYAPVEVLEESASPRP